MKEKVYFFASTEENLLKIDKDSQVYDKLTQCILKKSYELMSTKGIKPTSGILINAESGDRKYTIIERYDDHFSSLNCSLFIYYIPQKYGNVINNKTTDEVKVFKKQKIDNLYEYLESKKNIALIKNNNIDKSWYDIPDDNGDIIQKYFLSIVTEENKSKKKKMLVNLKKLFPKELKVINKLEKLMFKMDKDEFILFINNIYDKRNYIINYDTIRETEEEYSIKGKVKKIQKALLNK